MALLTPQTLSQTLVNVRLLLNQPNANNSTWSDAELTNYINEACRRYYTEAINSMAGYFTTSTLIDIVSGQDSYDLPSDCFQIVALQLKYGNEYLPLQYDTSTTNIYGNPSSGYFNQYSYKFRDNSIIVNPIPSSSESAALRLEYVYLPQTLVLGTDTISGVISPLFKDLIEAYAAYKAKLRESLVNGNATHTVIQDHVQSLYESFTSALAVRSRQPKFVIPYPGA